jgi:hypothetical protein
VKNFLFDMFPVKAPGSIEKGACEQEVDSFDNEVLAVQGF